jgi:(p)ppGpp synthase/HD superfamily hydrolase
MANIKNCLKMKNRIIGRMEAEFAKASRYNSISEKNRRPYSVYKSLQNKGRNVTENFSPWRIKNPGE